MSKINDSILDFMQNKAYKPMLIEELADVFKISKGELKEFQKILDDMEARRAPHKYHKFRPYSCPV